jgi:creatinine amidohydrolase
MGKNSKRKDRPYILAESKWGAVKDQQIDLAVLPWGATEAHNYHLPYATDNIQVGSIAEEAARLAWEKGAKVMVLPTVPFGVNTGQADIRLNINMYPSTQAAVLNDVTEVLNRHHVFKLLILNGHGGNHFESIIRETGANFPEMFIASCDWFRAFNKKEIFDETGDHADEMETSLMMYLAGEMVSPLDQAGDGSAKTFRVKGLNEQWTWTERKWSRLTEDTGVGNPRKATAEKGKDCFETVTITVSELLADLARTDIKDFYV